MFYNHFGFFKILGFILFIYSCNNEPKEMLPFENLESIAQDSTVSYFAEKDGKIKVQNSYFLPYNYVNNEDQNELFVFKVEEKILFHDKKQIKQSIFSPVFFNKKSAEEIKDWKIESTADKFELSRKFIQFEYFGNAEKEAFFEIYNIYSGKKVIGYSYGKLDIIFPSEKYKKTIGFHSRRAIQPIENNKENYLGYFTYSSDTKPLQKVHVYTKNSELFKEADKSTPVLEFEKEESSQGLLINNGRGFYFSENPTSVTEINFTMKATFYFGESYDGYVITIPVRNNQIQKELLEFDANIFSIEIE